MRGAFGNDAYPRIHSRMGRGICLMNTHGDIPFRAVILNNPNQLALSDDLTCVTRGFVCLTGEFLCVSREFFRITDDFVVVLDGYCNVPA